METEIWLYHNDNVTPTVGEPIGISENMFWEITKIKGKFMLPLPKMGMSIKTVVIARLVVRVLG